MPVLKPASGGRVTGQAPRGGAHPVEWGCELLGTLLLVGLGLSVVVVNFGTHAPLAAWPASDRFLLNGIWFAGVGSLVAVSPIGRRSGAHLNPVVTLAFWARGRVHPVDVVGYIAAQLVGATAGAALRLAVWGADARSVQDGATAPGTGVPDAAAVGIEAAMTAVEIATILLMTASARTARLTPLALWILNAVLVWRFAALTGTRLNPARSFGPAVVAPLLGPLWIYVVGPLGGGAVAVAVLTAVRDVRPVTAKLFHDPAYPSVLGSAMPVARAGAPGPPEPEPRVPSAG